MNYWLMKSEPSTWSWNDQLKAGVKGEMWDGVRNHQAAKFLKVMEKGDLAFFYHSGKQPSIVGIVKIIKTAYLDPTDEKQKFVAVTVKAEKTLSKQSLPDPVTLNVIKQQAGFDDFLLLKQSRLSVMPVSSAHWKKIIKLSQSSEN